MIDSEGDDPQFRITLGSTVDYSSDLEDVLLRVRQAVLVHLQNPHIAIAPSQLYPLFVYQALAKANHLVLNQNIIDACSAKHQAYIEHTRQQQLLAHQNQLRIEREQAETRLRKQAKIDADNAFAREHKLAHGRHRILFDAMSSAQPDMISDSAEHSFIIGRGGQDADFNDALAQRLRTHHQLQEVSSNARTPEQLRIRGGAFPRDNLCWLRTSWLSLLTGTPEAETLVKRMEEIGIREHNAHPLPAQLVKALHQHLRTNRAELLHAGETGAFDKPAHFRCGMKVLDYLAECGVEHPDLSNPNAKVEGALRALSFAIAMGARGTEKPRASMCLDSYVDFRSMMDSDFVMNIHRVMKRPCLIIERKIGQFITLKFSYPKDDTSMQQLAEQLTSLSAAKPLEMTDLEPLLQRYQHVPVIRLIDDHYSVYLPKSSPVIQAHMSQPHMPQPHMPQPHMPQPHMLQSVTSQPALPAPVDDETPATGEPHPDATRPPEHSQVWIGANQYRRPIEANVIQFSNQGVPLIVGQTARDPFTARLQAHLMHRLNAAGSTQPWFEFVSPRAASTPAAARYPGTVYQLQQALLRQHRGGPTLVVNGMALRSITPVPQPAGPSWIAQYRIEWADVGNSGAIVSHSATVASPALTDSGALSAHQLTQCMRLIDESTVPPALMSAHGLVRSGALAIALKAREAIRLGQLQTEADIDTWLDQALEDGRRDRGAFFMHNEAQCTSLRHAIKRMLRITLQAQPGRST